MATLNLDEATDPGPAMLAYAQQQAAADIERGEELVAQAMITGTRDTKTGKRLEKPGTTFMMITPDCFDPRRGGQRAVLQMIRRVSMMADASLVLFITEAWTLPRRDIMPMDFSEASDRKEIVRVDYENWQSQEWATYVAPIIRDDNKARLGDWVTTPIKTPTFVLTGQHRAARDDGLASLVELGLKLSPEERNLHVNKAARVLASAFNTPPALVNDVIQWLRGTLEERGVTF